MINNFTQDSLILFFYDKFMQKNIVFADKIQRDSTICLKLDLYVNFFDFSSYP